MAIRNFNIQHGLSLGDDDLTVIDSNANVITSVITSKSGSDANITINPDGTGVIDVSNKNISNLAEPLNPSDAATKRYVDATAQGLNLHIPAVAATPGTSLATITGGTVTYDNGTSGYNATLTLSSALTVLDGVTLTLGTPGDRVLIKDESDKKTNGIYTINSDGTVLTRALDSNETVELDGGDFIFIQAGTKLKATGWVQTTRTVVIGTDNIVFEQFSGAGAAATDVSADVTNVNIKGGTKDYVLAATDNLGNLHYANIANYFLVKTDITTVVAGSTLAFAIDYANADYPGGIYTLKQLGPVSMTMTDQWSQSGSNIGTSKNSYANYVAGTTNLANVTITFTLANANFSIQSSDNLTIGSTVFSSSSTPTLSSLLASTLNGHASGTVTIPAANLATSVEYNGLTGITNSVSANLTNDRGSTGSGVSQVTGTTLTSVAPVPFNVTSLSGTYATNPIAFFSPSQNLSWTVGLTSGATSITAGNITYANSSHSISGSLTSSGATSGTISVNSTYTYTLTTSDYAGTGATGAGARTIPSTVTGTVNPVNQYYPLFWQVTSSNIASTVINATAWSYGSNTSSSAHYTANLANGAGTTGHYGVSSATNSDYLWIATPGSSSRTFHFIAANQDIPTTPDVGPLTGTLGQGSFTSTYTIYGFSKFAAITNLYVS